MGSTIEIYMPTDNVNEAAFCKNTTSQLSIVKLQIPFIKEYKDDISNKNGIYILNGTNDDGENVSYIGESDNIYNRVKQHMKTKDYWDTAYFIINESNRFDKGHLHHIEYSLITIAKNSGNHIIKNGNEGQPSQISRSKKDECDNYIETIKVLLNTLHMNILKEPKKEKNNNDNEIFYCKANTDNVKVYGECYISDGKYVLKEGSTFKLRDSAIDGSSTTKSHHDHYKKQLSVISLGHAVLVKDNVYKLIKEYECNSPSTAANIIASRAMNGWIEWKRNSDSKTMDELYR